jgi:hypothetical protein
MRCGSGSSGTARRVASGRSRATGPARRGCGRRRRRRNSCVVEISMVVGSTLRRASDGSGGGNALGGAACGPPPPPPRSSSPQPGHERSVAAEPSISEKPSEPVSDIGEAVRACHHMWSLSGRSTSPPWPVSFGMTVAFSAPAAVALPLPPSPAPCSTDCWHGRSCCSVVSNTVSDVRGRQQERAAGLTYMVTEI